MDASATKAFVSVTKAVELAEKMGDKLLIGTAEHLNARVLLVIGEHEQALDAAMEAKFHFQKLGHQQKLLRYC